MVPVLLYTGIVRSASMDNGCPGLEDELFDSCNSMLSKEREAILLLLHCLYKETMPPEIESKVEDYLNFGLEFFHRKACVHPNSAFYTSIYEMLQEVQNPDFRGNQIDKFVRLMSCIISGMKEWLKIMYPNDNVVATMIDGWHYADTKLSRIGCGDIGNKEKLWTLERIGHLVLCDILQIAVVDHIKRLLSLDGVFVGQNMIRDVTCYWVIRRQIVPFAKLEAYLDVYSPDISHKNPMEFLMVWGALFIKEACLYHSKNASYGPGYKWAEGSPFNEICACIHELVRESIASDTGDNTSGKDVREINNKTSVLESNGNDLI